MKGECDVNVSTGSKRVCAEGMCGYPATKDTKACPQCGSKEFKDLPTDDSLPLDPSILLVHENPDLSKFGPGHDLKL